MKRTQAQLARVSWGWDERSDLEAIRTAALSETVLALDRISQNLQAIINRLDSLGIDGIHILIQEHAVKARLTRDRRLRREREKRRKKREAVKAKKAA